MVQCDMERSSKIQVTYRYILLQQIVVNRKTWGAPWKGPDWNMD